MIIHRRIHFRMAGQRRILREGPPEARPTRGRIPRIARLLALAIRLESLVRAGEVADYATLAAVGHVSRARITQITNLVLLAPDIQEAILFLPAVKCGSDPIVERDVRPIAAEPDWGKQRALWSRLNGARSSSARSSR